MSKSKPPVVILVRPQLSENIGTAARAMLNCTLTEMRLVAPRHDWLSERAVAASSGADAILHKARVFATTEEAIADLERIYATTGRNRFMVKPVMTPRQAAEQIRAQAEEGLATGVLFGPERTGLENDDVALADTVVMAPLNPSLRRSTWRNRSCMVAYEWFQAAAPAIPVHTMTKGAAPPATKETLLSVL